MLSENLNLNGKRQPGRVASVRQHMGIYNLSPAGLGDRGTLFKVVAQNCSNGKSKL